MERLDLGKRVTPCPFVSGHHWRSSFFGFSLMVMVGSQPCKFRGFGMVEEVPRPDMILSPLENGIPSKMERERGKKKDNIGLSYQFDVIT